MVDPNGFCPDDTQHRQDGVKVDASLGVEVSIEALERARSDGLLKLGKLVPFFKPGAKPKIGLPEIGMQAATGLAARSPLALDRAPLPGDETIAEVPIFEDDTLVKLDTMCFPFGEEFCSVELDDETQDWWYNEVTGGEEAALQRRATQRTLAFGCGGVSQRIPIKNYPAPSLLIRNKQLGKDVPVMLTGLQCSERDCPVENWSVSPQVTEAMADNALPLHKNWNSK